MFFGILNVVKNGDISENGIMLRWSEIFELGAW